MKKSTLILLIISIFYGYNACPQSNPRMENPNYAVTVFYDDFETGSNWRDKWIPGNDDAFSPANYGNILIWVDSTATINQSLGKLSLIARGYEGYTTTDGNGDPITADYISGSVKSKNRFLYGVFECNATFGYKHGSFPAFWLHFDSICGYDYGSEIDIVELKYEGPNPGLDTHAFYYPCATGGYQAVEDSWSDNPFNWSALNPHTFKCIWTPTKTEWYVDNTLLNTIEETEVDYYPNKTMVMILCQQLWPYDDDLDNIEVPVASTFNWVRAKEFFLAPEITCTPVICSSGTAAMDVAPSADSITWSLTPTNLFSGTKTGTGKNATITAASGASGQGKITYSFKVPSGESYETFTAEKTFWVGKPQVYSLCNHLVGIYTGMPVYDFCYSAHNDVEAVHPAGDAGIDSWEWRVTGGTVYPYGAQYRYATIYPTDYNNFMVEIRAHNNCGWTDWARMWTNVVDCYNYYLVFSPNPTASETTLSIESDSKENSFDETVEWDLEIYDQVQTLKVKKTKIKGKEHQIQTVGWKEGVYLVRIKYKDEILQGKLVVKR